MSRRGLIAVVAFVSLSLAVAPVWAGNNTWTGSGPTGGPIRAILVDPASPSTVYAGTLGGGVFMTTNGGDTWVQRGLAGLTIRALALDPTPPATIYAGVEADPAALSGGVFSSQDGGASWTPIDTGLTNKKVQALALDGTTLYAGTGGGGVFQLVSGTWTSVSSTGNGFTSPNCTNCPFQIQSLATDSRAPGTVYAGTEGAGVYKTTDGGTSWIRYPNPPGGAPFSQGWRSDCLEDADVVALLVDESQATETLYAGAKGRVGNSGCNQSIGGTGVFGQGPGLFVFKGTDPLWGRKMNGMYGAALPATFTLNVWALARVGNRIYAGTDFGVFTSNDQAGSWDGVPRMHNPPAPSNLVGLPIRALAASLSGTQTTLYAGSVGRGMFKRQHDGNGAVGDGPWTEKNSGLTALRAKSVAVVPAVGQPAASRILAGLISGSVIKSDDGGVTWQNTTETSPPTNYPVVARTVSGIAVDPADLTTVYAATGRGVIKSTDRGDTWTQASAGLPTKLDPDVFCPSGCSSQVNLANFTVPLNVQSITADPANPGVLYAAVGGVYTSVDSGATWVALNGTPPLDNLPGTVTSGAGKVTAIVVDPSSGDPVWGTLYAATNGFGVYRSINGGTVWKAVNTGIPTVPINDQFITSLVLEPLPAPGATTLYAGTSTGKVYRTNNGTSWQSVSTGLPGNAITALAIRIADPRVIYATLDGAGVYYSDDGGFGWHVMNDGLTSLDLTGLAVDGTQGQHALYAASLGQGMFHLEVAGTNPPIVFIDEPSAPYPFDASASPLAVSATVLDDGTPKATTMFWSTNRGHAGLATPGASWTASVPLEPGLNLVTLTAVDTDSNETSASFTVTLPEPVPVIFTDPLTVSFGTVAVGTTSAPQTVTVTNNGTASLVLGTTGLGGANPGEFKKATNTDLCSSATLTPTQSCTIGLRFKPTGTGAKAATLTIPSDDPVTPLVTVTLGGTGGGGAAPVIFVNPTTVPFGPLAVGGTSAPLNVTVTNNGTANLVLGAAGLGGTDPGQFKKGTDLCSSATLAPTQSCTIGVRFKPTSSGVKGATLTIPSNDPVTPLVTVTLSGTGGGGGGVPVIVVNPTTVPFGPLAVGGTSAPLNVTVTNNGTANLVLGNATLGGTDSGQFKKGTDLCSSATLAPTQSCTIGVRFKPTSIGPKTAALTIPSNDPDTPVATVPLTGTGGSSSGVPEIFVSPPTVPFDPLAVGGTSAPQTVTVRNDGTANLVLGAAGLGGTDPGQFKKGTDLCSSATLAPAQSCTIGVRFKPTSSGLKDATLTIPSNDPVTQVAAVTLSGIGQ